MRKDIEEMNHGIIPTQPFFGIISTEKKRELPKIKENLSKFSTILNLEKAEKIYRYITGRFDTWLEKLNTYQALFIRWDNSSCYGLIIHQKNDEDPRIYLLSQATINKGDQKTVRHCFSLIDGQHYCYGMNRRRSDLYDDIKNEVRFLRQVKGNQRFCQIIEGFSLTNNKIALIMEYFQKSLTLRQAIQKGISFEQEEKIAIICELFKAVHSISELEISHHDLSSNNVLLQFKIWERRWKVIIIDLGLAIPFSSSSDEGAALYHPPEVFYRLKNSSKVDVWSACTIVYELFASFNQFWGDAHIEHHNNLNEYARSMCSMSKIPTPKNVPKQISSFLKKTMKTAPSERPGPIQALEIFKETTSSMQPIRRSQSFTRLPNDKKRSKDGSKSHI